MAVDYKIKSALKSTKILVVEDDSVMIRLIYSVLDVMGFGEIQTVRNGEEALEKIATEHFDLIFCDWKMKGMDGIEFTRRLRAMPYDTCYTPVIMLTGKANKEDVEIARDAGVNEYMVKPFSVNALCAKVKAIVELPRMFVKTGKYSGPDRRRRSEPELIPDKLDRRRNAKRA